MDFSTNLKHGLSIVVHRQDVGDAILRQAFFVFCIWDKEREEYICQRSLVNTFRTDNADIL